MWCKFGQDTLEISRQRNPRTLPSGIEGFFGMAHVWLKRTYRTLQLKIRRDVELFLRISSPILGGSAAASPFAAHFVNGLCLGGGLISDRRWRLARLLQDTLSQNEIIPICILYNSSFSSSLAWQVLEGPWALTWVTQESMSLRYEPASLPQNSYI